MYHNETDHLLYDVTLSNVTDEYLKFYESTQFVIAFICSPIFGFFGAIGNVLSFHIFRKHRPKSSFDIFFMALCISDSFKIICDFLYFICNLCDRIDPENSDYVFRPLYTFAHYIVHASLCISAWLVVALTGHNYIAIYKHTTSKKLYTASRATKISISVCISMMLVTIPYTFHYKSEPYYDHITDSIYFELEVTEIWSDVSFSRTYTWFLFGIRSVVPLILTICLSICIVFGLMKNRITFRRDIIMVATVVTIVFVLCTFPDAVFSVITGFSYHEENLLEQGIHQVTDFLLLLNASVNIVIYIIIYPQFRNDLEALLFRRRTNEYVDTRRPSEMSLLTHKISVEEYMTE